MTKPFVLGNSYGPRNVHERLTGRQRTPKKFLGSLKDQPIIHPNHLFDFLRSLGSNWISNSKHDHCCAFASIKNELGVIRTTCFLWEISVDPRVSAKTNHACKEALENF